MKSHLNIKLNGKSLVLPEDFSISVEEQNPLFNDVTFFSYPAEVPLKGNLAALKNIGHKDSGTRAMELEHAEVRIMADGLPLNVGQAIVSDGEEIDKTFSFNIDAQQQSFSELINGLRCRDVRVKDKLYMGQQLGRITYSYNVMAGALISEQILWWHRATGETTQDDKITQVQNVQERKSNELLQEPQALGFSVPENINVTQPYPFPYCNMRVCYQHPGVKTNDDGSKETDGYVKGNTKVSDMDYSQYWLLDANRQQSGICFYVLYFLDCLFEQLGVTWDKSELLEIEDMKRLCFVTTHFKVDLEETDQALSSLAEINQWLQGKGAQIALRINLGDNKVMDITENDFYFEESVKEEKRDPVWPTTTHTTNRRSSGHTSSGDASELPGPGSWSGWTDGDAEQVYQRSAVRNVSASTRVRASICKMYANSDNFPDADVTSVISSLENSFGIRFLYDPERRHVTARLLRNVYKSGVAKEFSGKVISLTPATEKVTGVRMKYSAESDSREQRDNVRNAVRDYETDYDYIEYPEDRTITDLHYMDIIKQVSATNNKVYIDRATGNTYRVKINKEAEKSIELHPVLFQVGQFKGVEIGDCSERNEEYVKELVSNFQPVSMNIVNAKDYQEKGDAPIFAPLLDVDMEHEWLPMEIGNNLLMDEKTKEMRLYYDNLNGHSKEEEGWLPRRGHELIPFPDGIAVDLVQILTLAENYDPSQTEEGNSPLQDIDWGLAVAIMRGGGNDSGLDTYDNNYDGFGNDRWVQTVGTYAATPDSLTPKAEAFDYNGQEHGLGGEHFSLQIRSFVQPEWADGPICDPDVVDEQGNITEKIRSRGLFDSFMREHAKFLLDRKPYRIKVRATIAQLLDLRNHWRDRFVFAGKVGYINKISYNIANNKGVTDAVIDFYSI